MSVDMIEFERLLNEYRAAHPKAQEPLNYSIAFGISGIANLIKEANSREIVFEEHPDDGDDVVTYSFR